MNYKVNKIIENSMKNNKLSHAYLFYGDKGVDVITPAFESIKFIIESTGKKVQGNKIQEINYYDLKIVEPNEFGTITKESIDFAINQLFESSLEKNAIKILYIKDIDLGNKSSLNRMLKFVEEPVDNLVVFMNTNYFDNVISTIKSRSQNIYIKRENKEEKIKSLSIQVNKNVALLANIYSNVEQIKEINLDSFYKTYDEIIKVLEKGLNNKYILKEELSNIWTKQNSDFFLNIFQFFFYQTMTQISNEYPLFPNCDDLINKYKSKNINCFKIIKEIDKLKKNLRYHANFSLQKINFLNNLEEEMKY